MTPETLVDRLAAVPVLASVPREELAWLAAHGEMRVMEAGTIFESPGATLEEMAIMLSGRVGLYREHAGGESKRIMEATGGFVLGVIPYSRFQRSPGTVVYEETTTTFVL